jgi:hypothetical protein
MEEHINIISEQILASSLVEGFGPKELHRSAVLWNKLYGCPL